MGARIEPENRQLSISGNRRSFKHIDTVQITRPILLELVVGTIACQDLHGRWPKGAHMVRGYPSRTQEWALAIKPEFSRTCLLYLIVFPSKSVTEPPASSRMHCAAAVSHSMVGPLRG